MNVKRSLQAPPAQRLEALMLAAGRGSRFGGGKLLAPWGQGVLLEAALGAAAQAPARHLTVAVGADGEAVWAAARRWAEGAGQAARLRRVQVEQWSAGLSASLKAGVAALPPDTEGVFVFLGDMPRIPPSITHSLAEALAAGAQAAIPTWRGELAHPPLIGAGLFAAIAGLKGDRGARCLLEALGPGLARVACEDAGVLFDVDTREALAKAEEIEETEETGGR